MGVVFEAHFLSYLVFLGVVLLFVSKKAVTFGSIALVAVVAAAAAQLMESEWGSRTDATMRQTARDLNDAVGVYVSSAVVRALAHAERAARTLSEWVVG
jgi:hypothetical protein